MRWLAVGTLVTLLSLAGAVAAQGSAAEKPKPDQPKTHKVKKGDFRVEVKLSGVFEAKRMAHRPE